MAKKNNNNVHVFKNMKSNKALLLGGAALLSLGTIVYFVNSGNSNKTPQRMAPVTVTQNDVAMRDSGIGFEQDKLNLTQSSTRLQELNQEQYEKVVREKIQKQETDIVERRDHTRRIEYTPHDMGLDVIDVKVVQQEIEVPTISLTPLAKPEIVPSTPAQTYVEQQQYNYNTSYQQQTQPDTVSLNLAQAIQSIAQGGGDNKVTISPSATEFTGMDNYRQALADRKAQEEAAKTTAVNAAQTQTVYASAGSNQLTAYQTSSTVLKSTSSISSMYPVIKMGQIESAYTTLAANNKNMGPIQVVLTSGEYAGATLIGTVSAGNEALNFNFTEMYLPDSTKRVSISAIALKADTLEIGTYSYINKKWPSRIAKSILRGAVEFGSYYANEGTTTTTSTSTTTTSQKSRSAAEKVALGGIADEISTDVEAIDTTVEIVQERFSPIKVMFMNEVRITDDMESSSGTLERNAQSTNYVESRVDEANRPSRNIVATTNEPRNDYNNGYSNNYAPPQNSNYQLTTPVSPVNNATEQGKYDEK